MKIKGIYFLYRFLQALCWPVFLLYLLSRTLRNREYLGTLRQRLGFLPRPLTQTTGGAVWLHAVSVGEVLAAHTLVRGMRTELPRAPLFVSVSTLAGYATAKQKLEGIADAVFYAPLDFVFAVRRVLRALRPSVIVVAETEIWPNLFREARRAGAGLIIVNGRISDRALPRYLRLRAFFGPVLAQADAILAQSDAMRERFIAAGAPAEKVSVAGNLKYDFEPREIAPDAPVPALVRRLDPACVWIAASTMPPAGAGDVDEDDAVIAAFIELARAHPRLLLILVPRKPERFEAAMQKLEAAGVPWLRRSRLGIADTLPLPGVLLLDTMGELSGLFPLAGAVFMGGTLAARGGHNILEPALFGRPVIMGPHMENFREIAAEFAAGGAAVEIASAGELGAAVAELFDRPARAAEVGRRALACAQARRGATARALAVIRGLYETTLPSSLPPLPQRLLLGPLACLWGWGGAIKRARGTARRRRLRAPVISVGNITMGGTGKTPAVLLLAGRLQHRRPGILTRGYGRQGPDKYLVLEAGARVPAAWSGDEPQLFLRSGLAPLGIGPDRYRAGQMLEERFSPGVLILDDGFQHVHLERQVDLVLVDALDPFGGGALFPLGRLREPLCQLRRADILLITRSRYGRTVEALERRLRRYNPCAPIFRAAVAPVAWVNCGSGEEAPPEIFAGIPAGAFCGLGNPASFWATLDALGVRAAECHSFADHHPYRPHELRRLADLAGRAGAKVLLTTEKDMLNLGEHPEEIVAPLGLWWLKSRMTVEREDEFVRVIEEKLGEPAAE